MSTSVKFVVVLKNLENDRECVTLTECSSMANAETMRSKWRVALGGRQWSVNRRPGIDTLDHLMLTIIKKEKA